MTIQVNAYSTIATETPLDFPHEFDVQRDHSDPALMEHLSGFIGFIMDGGKREMTASLYSIMRHIERVHHQYSFRIQHDYLDSMADWGWHSNSIFYLPDGTVRDPAGAVLVDPDSGAPAAEAEIPFPADARARKSVSESRLAELGIETPDVLPPVVGEQETILRTAEDAAWRAIAMFIVAVRAESLASGRPIPLSQLQAKCPMVLEATSPIETAFLKDDSPSEQTVANMAWRYEALYVLQWTLGFHEELTLADRICDVPLVAETMVQRGDRQILQMAKLRPVSQILEAMDFNQRLLWSARAAKLNEQPLPANLDGGVIVERQHAFNWLTRFENADWDEVDTPS
ncbi:DUF4272 domain-containing protein [Planctomycetes bacterium K23_9]|uniref:DUF4272 domain-containing protein n=1 Tax=Stieleria marina TaxID=1930275 RepID=A0A517NTC8_9BACT|nr:hypothetical protein K239x_23250 [Planctomycetes bacterium K23_9]